MSFNKLKLLENLNIVDGLLDIIFHSFVYKGCLLSKQQCFTFQRSEWHVRSKLELVYFDLCGPITLSLINDTQYFLTIINDFSKKVWIYFLYSKYETFDKFKEFIDKVELECKNILRYLRFNGGDEYTSKKFHTFYRTHGI